MTNRKITFSLRKGEGKCWNLCAPQVQSDLPKTDPLGFLR